MLQTSIEKKTQPRLTSVEAAFPELLVEANNEAAQELGRLALGNVCEIVPVQAETTDDSTMLAALHNAKSGDRASLKTVKTNVQTDVAERLYKAGHITEVSLDVNAQGLAQNGRRLRDIHKNTAQHMPLNHVMRERTEIEHRNAVLFEKLETHGVLDDYDAVVFSMTPQDKTTREKYRFFTQTDSVSIQYLKKQNNSVMLETAMVAGKVHPNGLRHDIGVISSIVDSAGGQLDNVGDNNSLQHVLLVSKDQSHGVEDIVALYDDLAGDTFYGQKKPRQDYALHREACRNRDGLFDEIVSHVVDDLLAEAHRFSSPLDVVDRLDRLSDKYCVSAAVKQKDIDLAVFGAPAAAYIHEARDFLAAGDSGGAAYAMSKAHEVSTSSSCPTAQRETAQSVFGSLFESSDNTFHSYDEDKYGSLTFNCPRGHKNRRPRNKLIPRCKTCKVSVKC